MKLRQNLLIALLAAALCILAPLVIPVGPVPVSLATLGVYLAAGLLGPVRGTAAVGLYLLLGAVGLPVFAGFTGGFQQFAGVTGGFLWGYLLCALTVGLLTRISHRPPLMALWLVIGALALYLPGVGWYVWQTGTTLYWALLTIAPALLAEIIKIIAATGLIWSLRGRIKELEKGGRPHER